MSAATAAAEKGEALFMSTQPAVLQLFGTELDDSIDGGSRPYRRLKRQTNVGNRLIVDSIWGGGEVA